MGSIDTRLDRRDKAILQYINDNDGPNENQIVNALHEQKVSSKRTTLRKIRELKEKGEIIDSLKEGESGFHKLYINQDKSEFNKIYNFLEDLENITDVIFEPLIKMNPLGSYRIDLHQFERRKLDPDLANAVEKIYEYLYGTFEEAYPVLIRELLSLINSKVHSEKDKQILDSRILWLQQKFKSVGPETTGDKLAYFIARLNNVRSESPVLVRVKKFSPNFLNDCDTTARKLQTVLANFKNQFLSETEQKTKKPRKKSG